MKRVLVAEDDASVAHLIDMLLREKGFCVRLVPDGVQALQALQTSRPLPDLMIADLTMPRLGGSELIRKVKAEPDLCAVPVILLTGALFEAHRFPPKELCLGMLQKPFDLDELMALVEAACA